MSKRSFYSFILILVIFITASSCKSYVYIEPVPETFPDLPGKIELDQIDFAEIPQDEMLKIIINEYRFFIYDTRSRINHITILLINGNITPEEYDEAVKPYYRDLEKYTEAFKELNNGDI